ncbi:hypothetical protein EUTSA_v10003648mg [Eutrema salsugineum]|uniref:Zinc finger PHD-type domain-containing protein n=1 Tax=Eutrema salsugineum TaxID=72664 RepID=V4K4R5_EUTSA|nr:hypothetical protein EUTSA_v10003648mg [Eutrema salsugineum]
MDWSDEEGEILPEFVDDYYFVDQSDTPISFCELPVKWDNEDSAASSGLPVYLRGSTYCGYESLYKLAKAWKFDLSDEHPKIEVLLYGMHWITLQNPAKSYEALVRTILATLQCLHFVKRNPEASSVDVWNSLHKADGIQPSEHDLSDHVALLCQAMKRDEDLTKSKELPTHHQQDEQTPKEENFTVDNMTDEENSSDDDSAMNLQFDTVCSFCDNGGYILCCEGSCLRSFHATIADGIDSSCQSLGFPDGTQVHALGTYLCDNCLYKQHQCYACGQLGSSDENSSQEVFPCSASNCGHFYHPICVAKHLYAGDQNKSEELQAKIAARDSFCCPLHICKLCKTSENKNVYALHFAVCRRCPTAYHRKCLPWEITSELNCDKETPQRTWERLLPYNRILMYCLNHEIIGHLATPARDHLIFPDKAGLRTQSHGLAPVKVDVSGRMTDFKHHGGLPDRLGINESRKPRMNLSFNNNLMKRKMDSIGQKLLKEEGPSAFAEPIREDEDEEPSLHRVMSIIEEVESSFNFDEYMKSRGATHVKSYHSGNDIVKNITTGLVKTHVNAARAALKMFEEGREEDARAIFGPDDLLQLMKHKTKLEIYLSPFLHGMRYTSFGRHFTKPEKLTEIVERLHLYVQSGDTVVDFCCGSNDFSCMMNEKLGKMGKLCFFKNFDLIPPKNNFNFEKRDWLSVKKEELPDGSQLIMGLNPPFGYKSSLANRFIKKALEFKPKILILIVPSETKRVDEIADYDLIWKDTNMLRGMSFYLPGSIDVNDKTIEQWNNLPPPLYLWSRRDWSGYHKTIALQQGHITQMHHSTYTEGLHHAPIPQDEDDDNGMVQDMDISPVS